MGYIINSVMLIFDVSVFSTVRRCEDLLEELSAITPDRKFSYIKGYLAVSWVERAQNLKRRLDLDSDSPEARENAKRSK